MVVGIKKRAVGVFSNRADAESALHELKKSGFSMDRVSIIARDGNNQDDIAGTEVKERVGDKADEGAKTGAVSGSVVGGLGGLLVGLGALAIPGIGPIMLAGATATTLATTLAGAGIGAVAGSLLGALIGLGIPEERAKVYDERVKRGGYLVIIDGTDAEVATAEAILRRHNIEEFGIFNSSTNDTDDVNNVVSHKHALGYFAHLQDAEVAINDLRNSGFPLRQISLIYKDNLRQDAFAGINVSDRLDFDRFNLGDSDTVFYHERFHQGDYIVVISGTEDEINRAASILHRHRIQQWQVYRPGDRNLAHTPATRRAIGAFAHRQDAEAAVTALQNAGFPINQVSLIGKDTNGHGIPGVDKNLDTGNKADDGAKTGAATGGALGVVGGLLVGLGALAIPGVGPVIAGGAVATALATTLAGGAIGAAAGSVVGALVGLGIPENEAKVYSDRFQRGDYLIIIDGAEDQIPQAEAILKHYSVEEFAVFNANDLDHKHRPNVEPVRHQNPVVAHNSGLGDRVDSSVTIVDHRDERV